jgi:hypothetical protein
VFNYFINVLKFLIMNLENLNLVELSAQEVEQTEGGHPLVWILEGLAIGATALMTIHVSNCWRCQSGQIIGREAGPGGMWA